MKCACCNEEIPVGKLYYTCGWCKDTYCDSCFNQVDFFCHRAEFSKNIVHKESPAEPEGDK